MPPTEVGERLREARDRVKLKQAEAAETVGLSRTTLIAIEQGQRRVRIDELRKLANLYKMSINELMRQEAFMRTSRQNSASCSNRKTMRLSELLSSLRIWRAPKRS